MAINLSGLFNAKAILGEEQQWYYLRFLCLMAYQSLWVIVVAPERVTNENANTDIR